MMRRALLTLASAFLAYQSLALVSHLLAQAWDVPWWVSGILAVLLNLFVTGAFAFAGFAYPTHRLLPRAYYALRRPGSLLAAYRSFGVATFRRALLAVYWGAPHRRRRYFDGTRAGLAGLDYESRQAEFGHVGALAAIGLASALLLSRGYVALAGFATAINLLGNGYPVLLQRYHRLRLRRLARLGEREARQ